MTLYFHYDNIIYMRKKNSHHTVKQQNRKEIFNEQKTESHYAYPYVGYSGWRTGSTFLPAGHNTAAFWSNRSWQHGKQILSVDFRTCSGRSVLGDLP